MALLAERTAAEFQATAVDGFRALTAREDIDAILILAPQWYGPLPILAACDSGKAVYCAAALELEPDQGGKSGSGWNRPASRSWRNCRAVMRPPRCD